MNRKLMRHKRRNSNKSKDVDDRRFVHQFICGCVHYMK